MALVQDDPSVWNGTKESESRGGQPFTPDSSPNKSTASQKDRRTNTTQTPELVDFSSENRPYTKRSSKSDEEHSLGKPAFDRKLLILGCCAKNQTLTARYMFFVAISNFFLAIALSITALVGILTLNGEAILLEHQAAAFVILGCGILQALATFTGCVGSVYHLPAAYIGFIILATVFGGIALVASFLTYESAESTSVSWMSLVALCISGLSLVLSLSSLLGICIRYRKKDRHYSRDRWLNWCDERATGFMSLAALLTISIGVALIITAFEELNHNNDPSVQVSAATYLVLVGGFLGVVGGTFALWGLYKRSRCILLLSMFLQLTCLLSLGTASAIVLLSPESSGGGEEGEGLNPQYGYWEAQAVALLAGVQAFPVAFSCLMYFTEAEELYLADYV